MERGPPVLGRSEDPAELPLKARTWLTVALAARNVDEPAGGRTRRHGGDMAKQVVTFRARTSETGLELPLAVVALLAAAITPNVFVAGGFHLVHTGKER